MAKCKKCSRIIVLHAFSENNCEVCNAKMITRHIPSHKVCEQCSEDLKICEQCGTDIANNCLVCGTETSNKDGICTQCADASIERNNKYGKEEDIEI